MTRITIFPVVLWLFVLTKLTLQIAVSVSCSSTTIDLTFAFDEPFVGKIVTRPKHECSAVGKGTSRLKVTIQLDAETRNRCSIVEHHNEYVGIIDVQMHRSLNVLQDISYLIRCPKSNPKKKERLRKPQIFGAPTAKLTVFDKNKTAYTVTAGKQYDLKLVTTNHESVDSPVEMKQCIAFTGNNESQLIQLTDNKGCPTEEGLKYGFQAEDTNNLKTRIKMFEPKNSSTVYLQCRLKKCDPPCPKVNCSQQTNLNEIKVNENSEYEGALTSIRLDVQPTPKERICVISGLSRAIIYSGVLFLTLMCAITWLYAGHQSYKIFSSHFEFPSKQDTINAFYVVVNFIKRHLSKLYFNVVETASVVASIFKSSDTEKHNASFSGNFDYFTTQHDVRNEANVVEAPVPPVRKSIPNVGTREDKNLETHVNASQTSIGSATEQLNELELFPEPPSISVHDIQKMFSQNFLNGNSDDGTELSFPLEKPENQGLENDFKDDSSTLDRPLGKRKHIYLKRVDTLDVDGSSGKSFLPATRRRQLIFSTQPKTKLNVNESKLRTSLDLLQTETASNSSIERPRSTGTPYHYLSSQR